MNFVIQSKKQSKNTRFRRALAVVAIIGALNSSEYILKRVYAEEINKENVENIGSLEELLNHVKNYEKTVIIPRYKKYYDDYLKTIEVSMAKGLYVTADKEMVEFDKKFSRESDPIFDDIRQRADQYKQKIELEVMGIRKIEMHFERYDIVINEGDRDRMMDAHKDYEILVRDLEKETLGDLKVLKDKARHYDNLFLSTCSSICKKKKDYFSLRHEEIYKLTEKGNYSEAKEMSNQLIIEMEREKNTEFYRRYCNENK